MGWDGLEPNEGYQTRAECWQANMRFTEIHIPATLWKQNYYFWMKVLLNLRIAVSMMRFVLFLSALLVANAAWTQELNEEAQILKNASEKEMADFFDCIENRALLKYGEADTSQQIDYINDQAAALFEYFELRDSLVKDPASATMMLKVAWKWGAREGGLCEVEWSEALKEIRANLKSSEN